MIPQRYDFSSKSQRALIVLIPQKGCCWYHKGTIFQANHNRQPTIIQNQCVVVDTTKVRFFKQITTISYRFHLFELLLLIPQRYDFSSKSQQIFRAFSNISCCCWYHKGTIFQANHNKINYVMFIKRLLLIPQRYDFSSKSQRLSRSTRLFLVVVDTTKVRFFKQITTKRDTGKYIL